MPLAQQARDGRSLDKLRPVADHSDYAHVNSSGGMVTLPDAARGVSRVVRGGGALIAAGARHAGWFLRYQIDHTARPREPVERRRR